MAWWGKLLGGAFGFVLAGPLGALLGVALGHNFDRGLKGLEQPSPGDQERVQTAFFTAVFSVMGHVAKADGRVSPEEIRLAETLMRQMHLTAEMRKAAMTLFNEGKQSQFPLDDVLAQLRKECHGRVTLLQMFVEIQLEAAYADGSVAPGERTVLVHICDALGFSRHDFEHLEAIIRAARGTGGYDQRGRAQPSETMAIDDAYAVLDVDTSASDADVKRAYRRLMSQHHPDKLVAKGLPEEMIELATQKTQEIRKAYEQVKAQRGMG